MSEERNLDSTVHLRDVCSCQTTYGFVILKVSLTASIEKLKGGLKQLIRKYTHSYFESNYIKLIPLRTVNAGGG
jgi:hypothetical protein